MGPGTDDFRGYQIAERELARSRLGTPVEAMPTPIYALESAERRMADVAKRVEHMRERLVGYAELPDGMPVGESPFGGMAGNLHSMAERLERMVFSMNQQLDAIDRVLPPVKEVR